MARVDFLKRTVDVALQLDRDRSLSAPKSEAGVRKIKAPAALMDMLAAQLQRRGLTAVDGDSLVFANADGEPIDYSHFRSRQWKRAVIGAGFFVEVPDPKDPKKALKKPTLTVHDLRRTNATAMVRAGVDRKTAQARFGHSTVRLLEDVYAAETDEGDEEAATALGAKFMPQTRGNAG